MEKGPGKQKGKGGLEQGHKGKKGKLQDPEWRPVLFLTCSTGSTLFSNYLPACCLDGTKRYIFGHWIQVTFAVAHDVLICHGVFISWIVS